MHNTPATPRSIDATIARSWLLVNATKTDLFDQADQSDADQIILDIEDAVDPKLKPSARGDVATWLQNKSAWVRINDRSTPFWSDDVDHLKGLPGLVGVVLAKTESADHVTETFDRLGRHDAGPRAHRVGPRHRRGTHDRTCPRSVAARFR